MLIAIAVVGARRIRTMEDYTLGGRRLSSFTAALSTGSSTTSAWTMLALPALAFVGGLVELWVPVCAAIGVWLSWTLLAKRLRRFTIAADNAVTIPEFMERRFGDATGSTAVCLRAGHHSVRHLLRELRACRRVKAAGGDIRAQSHRGRHPNAPCGCDLHFDRWVHGRLQDGCIAGAADARESGGAGGHYALRDRESAVERRD